MRQPPAAAVRLPKERTSAWKTASPLTRSEPVQQALVRRLVTIAQQAPRRRARQNSRLADRIVGGELLRERTHAAARVLALVRQQGECARANVREFFRTQPRLARQHAGAGGAADLDRSVDPGKREMARRLDRPRRLDRSRVETSARQRVGPQQPKHHGLLPVRAFQPDNRIGERASAPRKRDRARPLAGEEPLPYHQASGKIARLRNFRREAQAAVPFEKQHRFFAGVEKLGEHEGRLLDLAGGGKTLVGLAVSLPQVAEEVVSNSERSGPELLLRRN